MNNHEELLLFQSKNTQKKNPKKQKMEFFHPSNDSKPKGRHPKNIGNSRKEKDEFFFFKGKKRRELYPSF